MSAITESLEQLGKQGAKAAEGAKDALESVGKSVRNFFSGDRYGGKVAERAKSRLLEPSNTGRLDKAINWMGRKSMGAAKGISKGVTSLGNSKAGMAAVGIGGIAYGMSKKVGPAVHDAAFETAFGDPNADVAFTGRRFDTRFLAGRMAGGIGGGLAQVSSLNDYMYANPLFGKSAKANVIGGAVVGGATGLAGAGIGAGLGMVAGEILGGGKGKVAGGILGFLGGGAVGGVGGFAGSTFGATAMYMKDNQRFFSESPYASNSSAAVANSLNASGDIVLGMHNSRRGY